MHDSRKAHWRHIGTDTVTSETILSILFHGEMCTAMAFRARMWSRRLERLRS